MASWFKVAEDLLEVVDRRAKLVASELSDEQSDFQASASSEREVKARKLKSKAKGQPLKTVSGFGKNVEAVHAQTSQAEFNLKVDRVDDLRNESASEVAADQTVEGLLKVPSDASNDVVISNAASLGIHETDKVKTDISEGNEVPTTKNRVEITYSKINDSVPVANLEDVPVLTSLLLKDNNPEKLNGNHPADAILKGSAVFADTCSAINNVSIERETSQKLDISDDHEVPLNTNIQVTNKIDSSPMKVQDQIEEAQGLLKTAASTGHSKEARLAKVCTGLSSRLQEYKSENAQLEELLVAERELSSSYEARIKQLQQDLSAGKAEAARAESHMAEVLVGKNAEIQSLVGTVDALKKQAATSEEKLASLQANMDSLMRSRDLTESRMIQALREELATVECRAEEERVAHNATKMAAMEREVELEHRAVEASNALARIQRTADESISRATELEHKLALLESECASLIQELQEMEVHNRRGKKKASEESSQILQLQAWKKEVDRARQCLREAENKISSLEAELQKMRVEMAGMKREADHYSRQEHMELEKRYREITDLLYHKQTQLEVMASQRAAAEFQLEKEMKRLQEAQVLGESEKREKKESAMIGTKKLSCKSVSKTVNAKKPDAMKVSPRNPLSVLNTPSIPSLHASSENKRRECFRIIHPNLSSKEGSSMRSKCQPRTSYSGPPPPISRSKCPPSTDPSSIRKKTRPKPISENPQNLRSRKPVKPKISDLSSISKELASGKVAEPDRKFNVNLRDEKESCAVSTSKRSFTPEGVKRCSIDTDGKQHISATPQSNSTPPIQASISPEVPCAFSVAPSPVCFATGHVMAGVQDRRRCRPCGILTIGAEHMKASSSGPPPLSDASVCWFSSPLEILKETTANASNPNVQRIEFLNEASVNWLLSPSEFVEKEIKANSVHAKSPISDVVVVGENTPRSRISSVLKTPTTDSSVSPFTVIVQRAESSSGLQILSSHKKDGQHRFDNALDTSPSEKKSWSNCSVVSAPSSYSYSRRYDVISPYEVDTVAEDLGAMSLLSKQFLDNSNSQNDISTSHNLYFEFCCQPTPLDSVDLNCFKSSRYNGLSKVEIRDMKLSAMNPKISWRDGLLSRIFEMGELDSYHSFFDDGEEVYYPTDDNSKSEFGFKCSFENGNGFGSYEFPVDNGIVGSHECQSKAPLLEPTSLAESFYTEGDIISSSDSDWNLFYKNNLFEV